MECVLFPGVLGTFLGKKRGKQEECDSASRSRIYGGALKEARRIIFFCQYQLNTQ